VPDRRIAFFHRYFSAVSQTMKIEPQLAWPFSAHHPGKIGIEPVEPGSCCKKPGRSSAKAGLFCGYRCMVGWVRITGYKF